MSNLKKIAKFKLLYPSFKDKSDDVINIMFDDAMGQISQKIFKSSYEKALFTLVAHSITYSEMIQEGDEFLGKDMTSYSIGGESFSFKASDDNDDNDYNSTPYGREFLSIRKRCARFSMPIIG